MPTNNYATSVGDPNACGQLQYRFVDFATKTIEITWMHIDLVTMEYWIDLQDDTLMVGQDIDIVLEVSFVNYPAVLPVYQFMEVIPLCAAIANRIEMYGTTQFTVQYDVT